MITPSFGLTATERVLPRLALDWTAGVAQPGVDVTRAGVATFVGSNGLIQSASADTQRIDWSTGTAGLLVEESRTNLLLNSLINGTSLGTQIVVVTATAHTLSFYGDGSVDLTGAHTATVNGSGAYPTRTTLTFTPSAGALTLTVTGTVQFAQLEAGAFPTSYIPTEAATVTRNADVATVTGTNFSDFYNQAEGTFQCIFSAPNTEATTRIAVGASDGTLANWILIGKASTNRSASEVYVTSVQASIASAAGNLVNTLGNVVFAYKQDNFAGSTNGLLNGTDVSGTIPTVSQLNIGDRPTLGRQINGWIHKINYWPQRLLNSETTAFSK